MKGIILAGGKATRLYPVTKGVCKQLIPVYDKPMVYYPLSVLMLAGIRDILIISTPKDTGRFEDLFGSGEDLGLKFSYRVQPEPKGIAEAFILAEDFIGKDKVSLILGDNIFYGHDLIYKLREVSSSDKGAGIFCYRVNDPHRYGIVEFDENSNVLSFEEKPKRPKSNWAVTGLYFYDNDVVSIAKSLKPSQRGELEITDVNKEYLRRNSLKAYLLGRGYAWLDTGTCGSLIDASMFIKTLEERQGLKIGCIEEAAFRMGYIDKNQLKKLSDIPGHYGEYLKKACEDE